MDSDLAERYNEGIAETATPSIEVPSLDGSGERPKTEDVQQAKDDLKGLLKLAGKAVLYAIVIWLGWPRRHKS